MRQETEKSLENKGKLDLDLTTALEMQKAQQKSTAAMVCVREGGQFSSGMEMMRGA